MKISIIVILCMFISSIANCQNANDLIKPKNLKKVHEIDDIEMFVLLAKNYGISIKDTSYDTECIVECPNKNKNELYNLSYQFIAKEFVSANHVIQFNDKETGTIICKGIFKCENHISKFVVDFILQIDSKDSKVRIKIYQQRLSINSQDIGSLEEIFTKHKHSWLVKRDYIQLNKEIKVHNIGLMVDYYESINNSKKDEW